MIRKLVLGASALALAVGGLAVTGGPASAAKVKMNATSVSCTNTNAAATFTPGLKIAPTKKVLLSFTSTQSGCIVTGGVAGAQDITNVAITGTGKLKNAAATGLLAPTPSEATIIKITLEFKNNLGAVLCKNKAKLATGPTLIVGEAINFTALSNLPGSKAKSLGGKCFKGKSVTTAGQLDQTVTQMAAAATGPSGVTFISISNGTLSIP